MSGYKFIAIPQETADRVRGTMKSPGYGHPAHREIASGYGPCRLCLKCFEIGKEERILFTLDPFYGLENLPLPGPVFIHAEDCKRYDEMSEFPEDLRTHPLTLNGYARGRRLLVQSYINDGQVDMALDRVLSQPEVDYVHVRDTNAGCYDLRVERRMEDKR
jgi:hypothetical protein